MSPGTEPSLTWIVLRSAPPTASRSDPGCRLQSFPGSTFTLFHSPIACVQRPDEVPVRLFGRKMFVTSVKASAEKQPLEQELMDVRSKYSVLSRGPVGGDRAARHFPLGAGPPYAPRSVAPLSDKASKTYDSGNQLRLPPANRRLVNRVSAAQATAFFEAALPERHEKPCLTLRLPQQAGLLTPPDQASAAPHESPFRARAACRRCRASVRASTRLRKRGRPRGTRIWHGPGSRRVRPRR